MEIPPLLVLSFAIKIKNHAVKRTKDPLKKSSSGEKIVNDFIISRDGKFCNFL
jgi:hypothetical protein